MRQKVVRVAIVGAGAGGLCALRHFASRQSTKNPLVHFKAVAYEQTSRVGGTWVYTDQTGTDQWGQPVHSSMYKNLRTNLPKECMAYPDYAFPSKLPSFVTHEDVEEYLEDYATNFDLWKHIKLQRIVKRVAPIFVKDKEFGIQWEVTTVDVQTNQESQTDVFDAVLVCNGHYSLPLFPKIPGLDCYQGTIFHSHDYREPSRFKDQTVVVLGAGSSGQDIAVEIATVAKQVYLSHNKGKLQTYLPPNMEQKPGIKHIHSKVLEFQDGSALEADGLILCTGYLYEFDFLSKDVGITIDDGRISPLYKHFLHTKYPSLGFVGIPKTIIPLPLFDVQIRFFKAVLEGSCRLPSEQEMNEDTEEDYQQRRKAGLPHRYAHVMADWQFPYNRSLADIADIERIPEVVEKIYRTCHVLRRANIMTYRRNNFELLENGGFKLIEIAKEAT